MYLKKPYLFQLRLEFVNMYTMESSPKVIDSSKMMTFNLSKANIFEKLFYSYHYCCTERYINININKL